MLVRETPEDVSRNNDSFLQSDMVAMLGYLLNDLDSESDWLAMLDFQYDLSDSFDCSLDKVHIQVASVVLKFDENRLRIGLVYHFNQNLDFL